MVSSCKVEKRILNFLIYLYFRGLLKALVVEMFNINTKNFQKTPRQIGIPLKPFLCCWYIFCSPKHSYLPNPFDSGVPAERITLSIACRKIVIFRPIARHPHYHTERPAYTNDTLSRCFLRHRYWFTYC